MINLTDALSKTGLLLCLGFAISCVDESYNLDKINDDIALTWSSLSAPLGNLETIKISDFVDVENNDYVQITSDGDYRIHFEGSNNETVFNVPSFKLTTNESDSKTKSVTYSPMIISGKSPAVPVEFKHGMEIHETSIPKEILSVESVKVNATLKPVFSFKGTGNLSQIILSAGTTLEFPEWVNISSYDSKVLSKNGTTLTLKSDTQLGSKGLDLTCKADNLDFTKLPDGQGLIKRGEVYVNDSLIVKGSVYIREQDITTKTMTDSFEATFSFSISEIEVISAKASVKPEFDLQFDEVDTKELSSIFKDGSNLDIYDLNINLSVNNDTPLSASISADIDSYKSGKKSCTAHVGPLSANAKSTSSFIIGKRSGTNKIENLTDLIANLPDKLGISNFDICCSEEPVEYVAGSKYTVGAQYSIDAPLSFGKNLLAEFDYDIKVGLDLNEMNVGGIKLKFDAENSIPLGMSLHAAILDENNNIINDDCVAINGKIGAGDLKSPSNNEITIEITPPQNLSRLESVRLYFKATCDDSHEGVCLNQKQGLSIKNISMTINDIKYAL